MKQLIYNGGEGTIYFARRVSRRTKSKQSRYVRVWTKLGRVLNLNLLGTGDEITSNTPARSA